MFWTGCPEEPRILVGGGGGLCAGVGVEFGGEFSGVLGWSLEWRFSGVVEFGVGA